MNKRLGYIVLAIALLVIIGSLSYWMWPSRVVNVATTKLAQARSHRFSTVIELENSETTSQVLGEQGTVEIKLDGAFERKENQPDSLASDIVLAIKTESVSLQLEGEMRFIEDKAYLLVEKAPAALPGLAQLKGQWIELPRGGNESASEDARGSSQLFTDIQTSGRGKVAGVRTTQYEMTATDTAIVNMMDNVAGLLGTTLTADQITNIQQNATQIEHVPVTMEISFFSQEIRQLSTVLDMPTGNKIQISLTLTDRNQPVDIEVPSDAVPLGGTPQEQ